MNSSLGRWADVFHSLLELGQVLELRQVLYFEILPTAAVLDDNGRFLLDPKLSRKVGLLVCVALAPDKVEYVPSSSSFSVTAVAGPTCPNCRRTGAWPVTDCTHRRSSLNLSVRGFHVGWLRRVSLCPRMAVRFTREHAERGLIINISFVVVCDCVSCTSAPLLL